MHTITAYMSTDPYLKNPGPHPFTSRTLAVLIASCLLLVGLWGLSMATHTEEPATIAPAEISSGRGVRLTVRATSFVESTETLAVRLEPEAVGDIIDERGILTTDLEIRVLDDEGVTRVDYSKGDPLVDQEIHFEMDGDVNRYPFDKYSGDFTVLAETVDEQGTPHPIALTIGTDKAETGWYTEYRIDRGTGAEEKITIVDMRRERFIVSFAMLLVALMLLVAIMAAAVGVLCVTNRRASDPGIVGWLVGLLFALPFVRRLLPGDPPVGCLLDVAVFSWALLICVIAMVLSMIAWIRQSRASHEH